jgi:ActR/RegA family two-component response regulator
MVPQILLIGDDDLLRRSLAFNFEKACYRVSTAASAEDGLATAHRDQPGCSEPSESKLAVLARVTPKQEP